MTTTTNPPTSATATETGALGALLELPLDQLRSTPNRGMRNIDELAASIREIGLLQPIIVAPGPAAEFYDVVDGRRRYEACRQAGLMFVPCIVRAYDDVGARIAALVANLERDDLKPLEEATQYHALVADHGLTQTDLAERVNRSEAHVSKRLSLLLLPDEAQAALASERITITTALGLTGLVRHPDRLDRALEDLPRPTLDGTDDPVALRRHQEYLDDHIAAELREVEADRLVADVTAQLKAQGDKVLDYPPGGDPTRIKARGTWRVTRKGEYAEAYTVDPRGHAVGLTTTPLPDSARHVPPGVASPTKTDKKAATKVAKERDAAETRRASVMRSILTGRGVARDKLAEFVAHQIVALATGYGGAEPDPRKACDLLDVQVDPARFGDPGDALTRHAGHGPVDAARAAGALMLTTFNPTAAELAAGLIEWDDPGIRNHYGFLAAHGYELTAEEITAFENTTPDNKENGQ